jgi:hypothetical protein
MQVRREYIRHMKTFRASYASDNNSITTLAAVSRDNIRQYDPGRSTVIAVSWADFSRRSLQSFLNDVKSTWYNCKELYRLEEILHGVVSKFCMTTVSILTQPLTSDTVT